MNFKRENKKGEAGELLSVASEKEWTEVENPYSTDLLNVKKNSKRVTVFFLPERDKLSETSSNQRIVYIKSTKESYQKSQTAAKMIQKVFQVLAEDSSKTNGIGITFSMKVVHKADL